MNDAPVATPQAETSQVAPTSTREASTLSEQVIATTPATDPTRFEKFQKARREERLDPTKATEKAAAAVPAAPVDRGTSKRQQERNDYERRIAESDERNRALIARLDAIEARTSQAPAPRASAPADTASAAPAQSDWDRYMTLPDAPQNDGKQSFEAFIVAANQFISEKKDAERTDRTRAAQREADDRTYLRTRAERAKTKTIEDLTALGVDLNALQTNPQSFGDELTRLGVSAEVRALKTFAQMKPGESGTIHHAIAEEIAESDHPIRVMQKLSEPGELARIASLTSVRAVIRAIERLDALAATSAAPRKTAAPPPPTTLTTASNSEPTGKAADIALGKRDFRAFRSARMSERLKK